MLERVVGFVTPHAGSEALSWTPLRSPEGFRPWRMAWEQLISYGLEPAQVTSLLVALQGAQTVYTSTSDI